MNKFRPNKNFWHIYIIIAAVLILSLVSATRSIVRLANSIRTDEFVNFESADTSNTDNTLKRLIQSGDMVIDGLEGNWSVFKESTFSKLDTLLTYLATGDISSTNVVAGKNHWLFYDSKPDGDSIADYEGTNLYSDKEISDIYNSAMSVQKKFEDKGIKFAILVPPNKENIYSENMPDTYIQSNKTRTDILVEKLSGMGVHIVSPKKELLNNHDSYQLYYSYDTHWNQLGAYIGIRDVLQQWGIPIPELKNCNISETELKNQYHYCAKDDLAEMIGLRSFFSNESEYSVDGTVPTDWNDFEAKMTSGAVSAFHNDDAAVNAKILVIGDSYSTSAIPLLRQQFSDVFVVHRLYFKPYMLDEIEPDYVITVFLERYSNEIKDLYKLFE